MNPCTAAEVRDLIKKAEAAFRHEECRTCECYLGYITQIMLDSDSEGKEYLADYFPPKEQVHSCLGCDPCPPGILYASYLRKRNK